MATRVPQFPAIPSLPQVGLQPWQVHFYSAIKENLEMLNGSRNGVDSSNQIVTKGQITVAVPPTQNMTRVTAEGFAISLKDEQTSVPTADDYAKLISNVQTLANDVANLRATVEVLIKQLKGS
jgi:hypothetical protein